MEYQHVLFSVNIYYLAEKYKITRDLTAYDYF